MNFSELLKKYQDSFIYVDERRKTREVLEQIVDIEEKPVAFLPEKRIGLLAENARNSIYFDGLKEVSVKLFSSSIMRKVKNITKIRIFTKAKQIRF